MVEGWAWAESGSFDAGLGRIRKRLVEEAVQVVGEAEARLQGHLVNVDEGGLGNQNVDDPLALRGAVFASPAGGGGGSGLIVCCGWHRIIPSWIPVVLANRVIGG